MNRSRRTSLGFLLVASIAIAGLLVFAGCKEEPEAQGPAAAPVQTADETVAAVMVQETCPIMGSPINEAISVEYQGKKVYFCCKGCPEKFLENPEQYVAKLPQFQP